jgi:hypothetical protein
MKPGKNTYLKQRVARLPFVRFTGPAAQLSVAVASEVAVASLRRVVG